MIHYLVQFDENEEDGVIDISMVESPANKSKFIAFNEHKAHIKFQTINAEKRLVIGLVLEPDVPIYRNDGGEEYTIQFDSQTIEKLAHKYLKVGLQNGNSIQHNSESVDGVSVVQSWIVNDTYHDKSQTFGLNYKPGSWVAMLSVNNDTIWDDYIKEGKLQGFSIEGRLNLQEIKKQKLNNMDKTILEALRDLPQAIKLALTPTKNQVIKLATLVDDNGLIISFDSPVPTVGDNVWVDDIDGNRLPLDIGEYTFEDGTGIVVSEVGIIGEVKPMVAEAPEEVPVNAPMAPVNLPMVPVAAADNSSADLANEISNAIKSILIKYQEQAEELKTIKQELTKLAAQPASEGIKTNKPKVITQDDYNKMSALEKFRYNK